MGPTSSAHTNWLGRFKCIKHLLTTFCESLFARGQSMGSHTPSACTDKIMQLQVQVLLHRRDPNALLVRQPEFVSFFSVSIDIFG